MVSRIPSASLLTSCPLHNEELYKNEEWMYLACSADIHSLTIKQAHIQRLQYH